MSGKVNGVNLTRDFFSSFSRLEIIRLFSYSLYFIYKEETEVILLFDRDCFALRRRYFCVSTEIVCQIKGGSFFKILENNLSLRERNLRLGVQPGKCRDRGGYWPAGELKSGENYRDDAAEQDCYVVLLYEMSIEMTRKRGRERGFQKNCVNYLW